MEFLLLYILNPGECFCINTVYDLGVYKNLNLVPFKK